MWRRHSEPYDGIAVHARALVDECEWYLAGEFAAECQRRGDPPPAWAWMNLFAHGTEAELRAMAAEHEVLGYVAGELLDLVDEGAIDFATYQHDVLVPLELDMFACPTFRHWTVPQLASGLLRLLPEPSAHRG